MTISAWERPWCAELDRSRIGEQVEMVGWVRRRRDLGGLVFVDLRDRSGLLQLVFEDSLTAVGEDLSPEDVVKVRGTVRERAPGQSNPELASGEIEIIMPTTNTIVRIEVSAWLSVCWRLWATLSMSFVTRLSSSPRGCR